MKKPEKTAAKKHLENVYEKVVNALASEPDIYIKRNNL
jgi:hypothetical protein